MYAVFQINSREYIARPGEKIRVDKLSSDEKTLKVDKVMLLVDRDKVEIGKPYLKNSLDFEIVNHAKGPKIRVATYKPKANYRRVKGQRREYTEIKLLESVKK